jgi:CHAD domain-containing protein
VKRYPVKTKASLKENMRLVLPVIFDDFMSYKDTLVNHPRLKNKLHEMRIAGKPMRYLMEIMLPFFGVQFLKCYNEIRDMLELTGAIHDCDVFIPELAFHLKELREFNKLANRPEKRISTKEIRELIMQLRENRNVIFEETCELLKKWKQTDFRRRLLKSITPPHRHYPSKAS